MRRAIAAGLLLAASSAAAEHEAPVYIGEPVVLNAWVCDTEEQVLSVLDLHRAEGVLAAAALLRSYYETPGRDDGPTCIWLILQPMVIERVVRTEVLLDQVGAEFVACAVEIATTVDQPSFWGLLAGIHVEPRRVQPQAPGAGGEFKGARHEMPRLVAPPEPGKGDGEIRKRV